VDDWDLYDSFYFAGHFPDDFHHHLHDPLYFLDAVDHHNLLNDHLDWVGFFDDIGHLHYLLYDLRHLHYPFFPLDNDDRLLNDSIDDDVAHFNVVFDLFGSHDLDFLDDFLNYLFDLHDLGHADDLFHYLFNEYGNLNYFLYNLFNSHDFLFDDLDFSVFCLDVVDDFPNGNGFFNFHVSVDVLFDYLYFGHFSDDFHYPFNDGGNFDCLFDDLEYLHDFLDDCGDDDGDFDGDGYVLLDLSDFFHFHYLLNNSFHCDDLRYFNDAVDDFLYDLFDLDYFGDNSEDFEDVVDVDHSQNLLVNHADDSLVDLEGDSCFPSDLLKFFEEGLDEHSEMELDLSGLLIGVGVYVVNPDYFRHDLDNLNDPFHLVSLDDIDQLLLEKLIESWVALISEFGVFVEVLLHLNSQHVDQVFGL
jgi:hypothetical protein